MGVTQFGVYTYTYILIQQIMDMLTIPSEWDVGNMLLNCVSLTGIVILSYAISTLVAPVARVGYSWARKHAAVLMI